MGVYQPLSSRSDIILSKLSLNSTLTPIDTSVLHPFRSTPYQSLEFPTQYSCGLSLILTLVLRRVCPHHDWSSYLTTLGSSPVVIGRFTSSVRPERKSPRVHPFLFGTRPRKRAVLSKTGSIVRSTYIIIGLRRLWIHYDYNPRGRRRDHKRLTHTYSLIRSFVIFVCVCVF